MSPYTIFTALDNSDGRYMLVHGYTGAIDVAPEGIVTYLHSKKILTPEEAPFSENTWNALVAAAILRTRR